MPEMVSLSFEMPLWRQMRYSPSEQTSRSSASSQAALITKGFAFMAKQRTTPSGSDSLMVVMRRFISLSSKT